MSHEFNKSKSLMAKHQLLCHGKFPVVKTAGCWCYLKKKNILFSNFSYVANNDGNILKTTTKIKHNNTALCHSCMHSKEQ